MHLKGYSAWDQFQRRIDRTGIFAKTVDCQMRRLMSELSCMPEFTTDWDIPESVSAETICVSEKGHPLRLTSSTPFPFETEPVVLYASESASGRKIFISNP